MHVVGVHVVGGNVVGGNVVGGDARMGVGLFSRGGCE